MCLCTLYLVFCLLTAPQRFEPQDGRANDDAELQGWQDNQHSINTSYKHLVGHNSVNFSTHQVEASDLRVNDYHKNSLKTISQQQQSSSTQVKAFGKGKKAEQEPSVNYF